MINDRAEFLADYQDEAYAKDYREFVAKVEALEAKHGETRTITKSVARNLFKLMSYKDEYEVARLFTNGDFEKPYLRHVRWRLQAELSPCAANARLYPETGWSPAQIRIRSVDDAGVPSAGEGQETSAAVHLNPFGYFDERKKERQLIKDYQSLMLDILPS